MSTTTHTTTEAILPAAGLVRRASRGRRVFSMRLLMLLEVLWALKGLAAVTAAMRLHGNMHANVRRDVIALDRLDRAVAPLAVERQVVCAAPTDMLLAEMLLDGKGAAVSTGKAEKRSDALRWALTYKASPDARVSGQTLGEPSSLVSFHAHLRGFPDDLDSDAGVGLCGRTW